MKLEDYATDERILRQLCKARIKLARDHHEKDYVGRLLDKPSQPKRGQEIRELLPPRQTWSAYRPRYRSRVADPNLQSLLCAARTGLDSSRPDPWVIRFKAFVADVQNRVLRDGPSSFASPTVKWELKENHKYRALCRFDDLKDNVINGIVAGYLRHLLDPAFESCSFAFRAASPEGHMPTHHEAFTKIYELRRSAPSKDLFVAECDIQGFYDCVDHEVALASLLRVAANVRRIKPDHELDAQALKIFQAYLDCYSFPQNVLRDATPRLKQEDRAGYFGWPGEALKDHHPDPLHQRIGVPQGGALSCIIANLVLDEADKRVLALQKSTLSPIHYIRYCDDMVLITETKALCKKAFRAYCEALKQLKLPYHAPEPIVFYGKEIWEFKSKAPYRWTGRKFFNCVPWIQFVGYQVRYDLLVRIKKKSFQKHIAALTTTTDKLVFPLRRRTNEFSGALDERISGSNPEAPLKFMRVTQWGLLASIQGKLSSIGVGRINPNRPAVGPRALCWASGYKTLHGKPFVPTFLRRFDRERERQIRRLKRIPAPYESLTLLDNVRRRFRRGSARYHVSGFRSSYTAQFTNTGGVQLIQNPYRGPWWERLVTEPVYTLCRKIWTALKGIS